MGEHKLTSLHSIEKLREVGLVFCALIVGMLFLSGFMLGGPLITVLFIAMFTTTGSHILTHALYKTTGDYTNLFLWMLAAVALFTPIALLLIIFLDVIQVFTLMRFSLLLIPALWIAIVTRILMHARKLNMTQAFTVSALQFVIGGYLFATALGL